MSPALLTLTNIHLTFGGDPLFKGADLIVRPRDRIALVGRNGSGKSTLMKVASKLIEPDRGDIVFGPAVTTGYLTQEPDFKDFKTIEAFISSNETEFSNLSTTQQLISALSIDPNANPASLSGGEARKAAIAQTLAGEPDILFLDEPTNHLDLTAILWLEEWLTTMNTALVVISHDRRFLENTTTQTVWIDRGITRSLNRGFSHFEDWRDKILDEEELERHKLDRKIVAEEHWVRYGVTARRKRNVRRMRELGELRRKRKEDQKPVGSVNFATGHHENSGKRVIVAENIAKAFGDKNILSDFSIEITRGDRIGIVGPNGAGKTTLLKLLIGELSPDKGTISLGTNLDLITLDQRRSVLDENGTVADAITDGRGDFVTFGDSQKHVSTYLKDFLFNAEQWRAKVSTLSGGEKGRLALASALARPSNLLVLDEPTNDLDLETLELLEELISNYKGTLILVSHDRSFLDRLVTSILTTSPDNKSGQWLEYAGGFEDMVAQRGTVPGLECDGGSGSGPRSKTSSPEKKASSPPARQKTKQVKLSYKEKYLLENLPNEMATLEAKIVQSQKMLDDPELFSKNPDRFNEMAAELEGYQQKLAQAEESWLELELKKETFQ